MRPLRSVSTPVFFGFWLLITLGVNSANSLRSDEPVASTPQLRGSATVLPHTDPFRDLKMMVPQSEEVLRILMSCKDELCLYNSQKAPVVTQVLLFGLMEGKRQIRRHFESTSDPKMQAALARVQHSFGETQKALTELHNVIEEKAALPR